MKGQGRERCTASAVAAVQWCQLQAAAVHWGLLCELRLRDGPACRRGIRVQARQLLTLPPCIPRTCAPAVLALITSSSATRPWRQQHERGRLPLAIQQRPPFSLCFALLQQRQLPVDCALCGVHTARALVHIENDVTTASAANPCVQRSGLPLPKHEPTICIHVLLVAACFCLLQP